MPIRGHSGVQGGAEMGAYTTVFPGGKPIDDANADALEALWGFRPPARVGMDTSSMLEAALAGRLDALYAIGGNFLDTLPQPADVERALANIPLRIHQDIGASPAMLVEPRDTVFLLPAKTRYEHDGGVTETTTERRVVYSPAIPGHRVGEAREEWRIAIDIAKAARPGPRRAASTTPTPRPCAATSPHASRATAGSRSSRRRAISFSGAARGCAKGGLFPLPEGRAQFVASEPPDTRLPAGPLPPQHAPGQAVQQHGAGRSRSARPARAATTCS